MYQEAGWVTSLQAF